MSEFKSWDEAAYVWVTRLCAQAESRVMPHFDPARVRDEAADIAFNPSIMHGTSKQQLFVCFDELGSWALQNLDNDTIEGIAKLLVYKQRRYGCANILRFGFQGIVIRMSDKVERILQQQYRQDVDDEDPFVDLVGYAVIAHMVNDQSFTLPLLEDQ